MPPSVAAVAVIKVGRPPTGAPQRQRTTENRRVQAKSESARKELQRCAEEIDEANLRSLTTASLYNFRIMLRRYELDIESPALRDLALMLLPAEMRAQP